MMNKKKERHILSLSGGKDSAALALHMRDRIEDMEYVFCDTGKELKETYKYLNKMEAYLGKPIIRLNPVYSFDHWLEVFGGFLPSPLARWCTKQLKLKPFEQYCGDDIVHSYIGIRADEDRIGYISHNPNINPIYPFKEDGINKEGVFNILKESGVGIPDYYKWRSRSGCYFCFYQKKAEWIRMREHHPDLFEQALKYEKTSSDAQRAFTWVQGMTLSDIVKNQSEILKQEEENKRRRFANKANQPLSQVYGVIDFDDEDGWDTSCIICYL